MDWELELLLGSIFAGDEDFNESAVRLAEGVIDLYREMDWTISGYIEPQQEDDN